MINDWYVSSMQNMPWFSFNKLKYVWSGAKSPHDSVKFIVGIYKCNKKQRSSDIQRNDFSMYNDYINIL